MPTLPASSETAPQDSLENVVERVARLLSGQPEQAPAAKAPLGMQPPSLTPDLVAEAASILTGDKLPETTRHQQIVRRKPSIPVPVRPLPYSCAGAACQMRTWLADTLERCRADEQCWRDEIGKLKTKEA